MLLLSPHPREPPLETINTAVLVAVSVSLINSQLQVLTNAHRRSTDAFYDTKNKFVVGARVYALQERLKGKKKPGNLTWQKRIILGHFADKY